MTAFSGVIVGTVTDVNDPSNQGRIRVQFPWLGGTSESHWAPVAAPMAGNGRGMFFMPEPDDEVLVAFDHGDTDQPVVIGFLWSGRDQPPTTSYRERMIKSVNGHMIRFLDTQASGGDAGAIVIEDAHRNTIVLSNGKITIRAAALLELRAPIVTINGRVVSPNPNPI